MDNFCLFDAGGTKTEWIILENGNKTVIDLPGYNPNRDTSKFEEEIIKHVSKIEGKDVFFYGAGLATMPNQQKTAQLFTALGCKSIKADSDILGSARALFGDQSGVFAIMGTGGLSAYYDGVSIQRRIGGHGYLINDLGGGYDLGKRFLSLWLDGVFEEQVQNEIQAFLGGTQAEFIQSLYEHHLISKVSELTRLIKELEKNEAVNELTKAYFKEFIEKNIQPLCTQFKTSHFSIVGSVGHHFQKVILEVAKDKKLEIKTILKQPANQLLHYHLNR